MPAKDTTAELVIHPVPALADNYIWVLHRNDGQAVVVDPGEAAPVIDYLERHDLSLYAILITHHHWDHTDGVAALAQRYECWIFGPDDPRCPPGTRAVSAGQAVRLEALDLIFQVMEVPAHTSSHIAFFDDQRVFTGDTLFSVGCGKLFEGSAAEMQDAMDQLRELPDDTAVYCGHEYTVSNCDFALKVEPDNEALLARSREARHLRENQRVTLPSTIGAEKACNPFMRSREPAVVDAVRQQGVSATDPADVLGALRRWKDQG